MVTGFPELMYQAKEDKRLDLGPTASSLDLLQAVYRDPSIALPTRMRAAMACLPHEVPKLAVTAQVTEGDFATLLDRRLKRLEEMKLIEANGAKIIDAQPINGKASEPKPEVETKPPLARTPDRRFRRF
jgi:hypothetical protein